MIVVEFFDDHSGFAVFLGAVATLVVAAITLVYVLFTRSLMRHAELPIRRETVERLLIPLRAELQRLSQPPSPQEPSEFWGLPKWHEWKREEPMLAFRLPASLREALDEFASDCQQFQESGRRSRLWHMVARIAAVTVPEARDFLGDAVESEYLYAHIVSHSTEPPLQAKIPLQAVIIWKSPSREILRQYMRDRDTLRDDSNLTLIIGRPGHWPWTQTVTLTALEDLAARVRQQIEEKQELADALTTERRLAFRAKSLVSAVERQITKYSA